MPRSFGRPNVSIFIRNLPYEVNSRDLEDIFEKYGNLKDVYIPLDYHTRVSIIIILMSNIVLK